MEQRSKLDICHKIHSGKVSLNLMSERKAQTSQIISNNVINIYAEESCQHEKVSIN